MRILENYQTNGAGNQERKKLASVHDTGVCSVVLYNLSVCFSGLLVLLGSVFLYYKSSFIIADTNRFVHTWSNYRCHTVYSEITFEQEGFHRGNNDVFRIAEDHIRNLDLLSEVQFEVWWSLRVIHWVVKSCHYRHVGRNLLIWKQLPIEISDEAG